MNGSQHYKSHSDSEQSITEEISGDDPMSERDSDPISPEYVEHVVSGVVERWLDLHGEKLFQLSSSKYLAKQQTKKARDSKKKSICQILKPSMKMNQKILISIKIYLILWISMNLIGFLIKINFK